MISYNVEGIAFKGKVTFCHSRESGNPEESLTGLSDQAG